MTQVVKEWQESLEVAEEEMRGDNNIRLVAKGQRREPHHKQRAKLRSLNEESVARQTDENAKLNKLQL